MVSQSTLDGRLMNYYMVTPKQATCEEMKMEDVIETAIAFKKALMAVIENSTDLDLINWAECQEDDITNTIQQGKEYADITVERRQAIEERLLKYIFPTVPFVPALGNGTVGHCPRTQANVYAQHIA